MKLLYKNVSLLGLSALCLVGCGKRHQANAGQDLPCVDTVVVLEYVHPSQYSQRKIWVADKAGNEFYCNNVSLGHKPTVAPCKGEEVVIERGVNRAGAEYLTVLENLSAQKLKQKYMNQK